MLNQRERNFQGKGWEREDERMVGENGEKRQAECVKL